MDNGFFDFDKRILLAAEKAEKSAVKRNRIRRRIYEVLRTNFESIPKKRDYIFVVYTKDLYNMKHDELEKIIGKLVSESKI